MSVRSPSLSYPCANRRGCLGALTDTGRYRVGFHLLRWTYNNAMYIIIGMNIYITPANEEHLRKEQSMSGLINRLLEKHYGGGGFSEVPVTPDRPKRDPDTFTKLKKKLDVREPITYKKGGWGA